MRLRYHDLQILFVAIYLKVSVWISVYGDRYELTRIYLEQVRNNFIMTRLKDIDRSY